MQVIAKFRCNSVLRTASAAQIEFRPVTADGSGNEMWSKYTPSGQLSMTITNEACMDAFNPGKEYFLLLSDVDPTAAPVVEEPTPDQQPLL